MFTLMKCWEIVNEFQIIENIFGDLVTTNLLYHLDNTKIVSWAMSKLFQ